MTPDEAVNHVNFDWVYDPDGRIDRWGFTTPGDCENYGCRVLMFILGSEGRARRALLTGRAHMIYCHTLSGEGHAVLEWQGRYVDNRLKTWVDDWADLRLREKRRRYTRLELLAKLGVGRLFGWFD